MRAATHLSEEAAGLLQAGLAIALSIGGVLAPANTLYLASHVNRAIPAAEKTAVAEKFLPRLIFLYCLGALPVLLFPEVVLRILYSNRFTPAAALLPWFVAWQCLCQISGVYQQLLVGLDDLRGCGVVTVLGNMSAAALCLWLTGLSGLLGIAAALVAGAIVLASLAAIRLHSKHRLSVPRSTAALAAFALLGFLGISAVGRLTAEMTLTGVGVRTTTAVVFLTGLWFVLPKALRFDLSAGMTSRMRALTSPTVPPT